VSAFELNVSGGDPRVRQRLDELGLKYVFEEGYFKLLYATEDGRGVACVISSNTTTFLNTELRELSSPLEIEKADWNERLLTTLLEQNHRMLIGSWGLVQNEQEEKIVLFRINIHADVDAQTLGAYLDIAVRLIDDMNSKLLPSLRRSIPIEFDLSRISEDEALDRM
jgi:hypothetical protein